MNLPAWHIKNRGYINADGKWGRPKQNYYALIWPKDKPNLTKFGRLRDIMTGKGPDIFVTSNPNRKPHAMDGPSRRRWTGFPSEEDNINTFFADNNSWRGDMPWLQPFGVGSGIRDRKPFYDFRTRKFRSRPHAGQWTDVRYPPAYRSGQPPNAVEMWPNTNQWIPVGHPDGDLPYFDPVNWGQNGDIDGFMGDGGYYNPAIDGWP